MSAKAAALLVLLCLVAAFVWLLHNDSDRAKHASPTGASSPHHD